MTPQGAPNDAAKVADSAHQDAPNRESTLGASEVLDNFRETSVVLPLQSTQDSETILKHQEEQCAEPLVKEAQAKDHGSSQEQQQQQANTGDGCAVPPLEQGSASRAPETAPELPDSPQATEERGCRDTTATVFAGMLDSGDLCRGCRNGSGCCSRGPWPLSWDRSC